MLTHLAGQLDSAPLLLLLSTSTELDWPAAPELTLEPLPAPDVAGLVQALLPGIQLGMALTLVGGQPAALHGARQSAGSG